MKFLFLFLSCLTSFGATGVVPIKIASPRAPGYALPKGWNLEEVINGTTWVKRATINVSFTTATNVSGGVTLSNVTAGVHTYRGTAFGGTNAGVPSNLLSTNVILPPTFIYTADFQNSSNATTGFKTYTKVSLPPVPGITPGQYWRVILTITNQ